jgi:hypothetical protein
MMGKGIFGFFDKPTLEGHQLLVGKYHDGNVRCEYILQNEEKVFDGPFSYEYKYGSLFSDKGYERADGTFNMNRKQGHRKMEYHLKQRDRVLVVNFEKGRVEGEVDYRCAERDYMGRTTSTAAIFSMHNGRVVGEVHGMLRGKKFKGSCDDNGCPDGEWKIEATSEDNTLSHIDCEMWSHGKLLSSYSEMTQKKTKSNLHPYLLKTFSELINGDLLDMLFMVRRGTHINSIDLVFEK